MRVLHNRYNDNIIIRKKVFASSHRTGTISFNAVSCLSVCAAAVDLIFVVIPAAVIALSHSCITFRLNARCDKKSFQAFSSFFFCCCCFSCFHFCYDDGLLEIFVLFCGALYVYLAGVCCYYCTASNYTQHPSVVIVILVSDTACCLHTPFP